MLPFPTDLTTWMMVWHCAEKDGLLSPRPSPDRQKHDESNDVCFQPEDVE
jgi:hypothetical protein